MVYGQDKPLLYLQLNLDGFTLLPTLSSSTMCSQDLKEDSQSKSMFMLMDLKVPLTIGSMSTQQIWSIMCLQRCLDGLDGRMVLI
jgi:hypothetical protein